jgi:predicted nucleic acid-binding protein
MRQVRRLIAPFPILWPSEGDFETAVNLLAAYKLSDGLDLLDALIAATAIRHDLPLATFNVKHFRAIPDLTIVQPYIRG